MLALPTLAIVGFRPRAPVSQGRPELEEMMIADRLHEE
jgi:hypothetical protein